MADKYWWPAGSLLAPTLSEHACSDHECISPAKTKVQRKAISPLEVPRRWLVRVILAGALELKHGSEIDPNSCLRRHTRVTQEGYCTQVNGICWLGPTCIMRRKGFVICSCTYSLIPMVIEAILLKECRFDISWCLCLFSQKNRLLNLFLYIILYICT